VHRIDAFSRVGFVTDVAKPPVNLVIKATNPGEYPTFHYAFDGNLVVGPVLAIPR